MGETKRKRERDKGRSKMTETLGRNSGLDRCNGEAAAAMFSALQQETAVWLNYG